MQSDLEEQLALTMELRDALEGGSLELAYQPQVDDAGDCFGVEALLRWNHPVRGPIPPSDFIPLAERAALGAQIDAFVLAAACATLRRWHDDPVMNRLQMAVNVGSRRLDASLVALVTNAVKATGVDARG
jgi:EAL domain-containing protein (putative c-di-GMP-specific phosphodiesterase class I)